MITVTGIDIITGMIIMIIIVIILGGMAIKFFLEESNNRPRYNEPHNDHDNY